MESWRERGFVPDSDSEDGFDSQDTKRVSVENGAGLSEEDKGHISDLLVANESPRENHVDDGSHKTSERIGGISDPEDNDTDEEEKTPTASTFERTGKQSSFPESPSLEVQPVVANTLFSQTLSEPNSPTTPRNKPRNSIWDTATSSPDELALDWVPPQRHTPVPSDVQNQKQSLQGSATQDTQNNDGSNSDTSPLSSPPSSIRSLSLNYGDENDEQGGVERPSESILEDLLPHLDVPQDILEELTNPARRSLRQRNPIQLHPYMLEDAKYRHLMQQGGIRPVRIAQYQEALRAKAANESQGLDYVDGAEPPSSSPGLNPQFTPSSPAGYGERPHEGASRREHMRTPGLPGHSLNGESARSYKRRKVSKPTNDGEVERLRRLVLPQVVIENSPSYTRRERDSIFDAPPSPPHSGSVSSPQIANPNEFRFPRGLSPPAMITPSTASRRDKEYPAHEDEEASFIDWHGDEANLPSADMQSIASQSEAYSDMEEPDEGNEDRVRDEPAVQAFRRRIKGVLPASWLRLDQQKQQESRLSSTQRNRDPSRPDNAKGVARKILKKRVSTRPASPSAQLTSLRHLADHDSSDGSDRDENSKFNSRRELAEIVGFDASFDDQDMGDDAIEDNRIDYMFPPSARGPNGPRSKKNSIKRHGQNRSPARFEDQNKRPRLQRQSRITDPIYGNRQQEKQPVTPRLGILDAPDVASNPRNEQPQFLRVAARSTRSRRDKGRRSPSRKVFQLNSRADTEDANSSLRQWRMGRLRQTTLTGPQTKPHERHPLRDLPSNTKIATGNHHSRLDDRKPINGDRLVAGPKESGVDPHLQSKESPAALAPGSPAAAVGSGQTNQQGRNWIVRRNIAISSLQRSTFRPAIPDTASNGTGSAPFQRSLAILNPGNRYKKQSKSRGVNLLLDRFLRDSSSTPEDNRTQRRLHLQEPKVSDNALPTQPVQIRRHQIRKRQPKRVDVNTPEYQDALPIGSPEAESFGMHDAIPEPTRRPEGLNGFRRAYPLNFDTTPLHPGTFFHESTFIGSGQFSRSLDMGRRDIDKPAGISHLVLGNLNFRWDQWNDGVSSELGLIFTTIIETIEKRDVAHNMESYEDMAYQCCTAYKSLVKYLADDLAFIDPIDRSGFIHRVCGLVSKLNDGLTISASTIINNVDFLTRVAMYNLVFANQTHQIACHSIVPETVRIEASELVMDASRQVAALIITSPGQKDMREFLQDNQSRNKRDAGIRDNHPAVEACVVINWILRSADHFRGVLEDLWAGTCSLPNDSRRELSKNIDGLEARWQQIFTMSPLMEIDASGIAKIGSRFNANHDNWPLVQSLLNPVLDSYDTSLETPISYNNYCRVLFHRCFHLIDAWGWRDCKKILDTLYDFFAKNTLYNLKHEECFGSPSFLDRLDERPLFDIKLGEPCFHILLKIIATGFHFLAKNYEKKKIRNFAWRLLPNHGRVYPKEKSIHQTDLDALRNHHDLLCTLYFAVPDGCRPRLEAIKNLVDPASSHREICNISIRSWTRLVRFKLSTNEDVSGLEQFADWYSYFVTELLKQHSLARGEVEAQNTGNNQFSHRLIERTISQNQHQIESMLKTALHGLEGAIKSAHAVEHAEKLVSKAPMGALLGLFDPRIARVNTVISEALKVMVAYLQKCNPLPGANVLPSADEDSQEYGDWTDIAALYDDDDDDDEISPVRPQGIALVESVFHPAVSRLVSNCFGEDDCPEDTILLSVVDCWTSIAHTLVKHRLRHWDSYLSAYESDSWVSLRSTIQTRKYTPKFLASCIEKDVQFTTDCRIQTYSMWMSSLVERSSKLKFQHSLTEALLNRDSDDPMLQNLPFSRDPLDGRYSITLEDLSHRRLSLISSLLSNMRAHVLYLEDTDGRDLSRLKQEYRELTQSLMSSMKANYQELGGGTTVAQGDYVEFVHRVVGFLQQYTRDICPIDPFFTDPTSFPLPSGDPTYIVARLKSYEPKLSTGKFAKSLVVFIQAVSERAALDGQQGYLVEQLHASMVDAFESGNSRMPTLRALLLQSVFPAYLETVFTSPAAWVLCKPVIQTISLTFNDLLSSIDTTDSNCVASVVDIFTAVFRSSYHALLSVVDNADLLKTPSVVLTVGSFIGMLTSGLRIVDYIDRATDLGNRLLPQVRWFHQFVVFAASYIHGQTVSDPMGDWIHCAETFANECGTATPTAPDFFHDISHSATRELRTYINESWSQHQGKYYFTRRAHPPQEVRIGSSTAAMLESLPEAGLDSAAASFLDTLVTLDLFGEGES
ncbi:hypothetical protein FE257_003167 [Aspergillus nanangensis]|uniref:Mus7/MMS22 family-domain-containing protein n=1 Tax=Aspergillus nanangensis TaxID=2582783 RepID=A0AAD4CC65_ASPNN|nr:hypothetical protein FE257_003167 [Aspergillus nanangensis]